MIKDRIIELVNQYAGQFVENINHDNLHYSILGGNVELRDLVLKPTALVEFLTLQLGQELPFEVTVGHVDYIRLHIPWKNLFGGTEVRLELDGLYLLLGPITNKPYDKEREENLENAVKQAALHSLDPSLLQKVSKEEEKNPGLFEKIGKYILNNIQIKISNIHIRYEDSITSKGNSFAASGILGGIYLFTTNDRWEETELDSTAKILHKLGRVSDLSLHWNYNVKKEDLVGEPSLIKNGQWKVLLKQSVRSKVIAKEKFIPILETFTAEAKVTMSNIEDFKTPKLCINLATDNIGMKLSRHQYLSVMKLVEYVQWKQVNRKYRKYRPNSSVTESPKRWWLYAYSVVLEYNIRPFSWYRIVQHKQDFLRYSKLYKHHLESPKDDKINSDLKEMETVMDVTNILRAREEAKVQFALEAPERDRKKKEEKKKSEGGGWFSWIWGGSSEEEEELEVEESDLLSDLSEEEKLELYQGIGYDKDASQQAMPREYVAYKIQLNIVQCCGTLENYDQAVLRVAMKNMLTSYENRPGGQGVKVVSSTKSFSISGASVDSKLVDLLTSNGGIYTTDSHMFTMEYELRPLFIPVDQSLKLGVRPVEIFYDQHAVSQIIMFFQASDSSRMDFNELAISQLSGVVKYSKDALLYTIEQQSTFHISVHMRSPYIVIPQNGTLHRDGNVMVIDFGMLSVESELQDKTPEQSTLTDSELQSRLYDKFQVKVTDVKVLIADSGEDWHLSQTQGNSKSHILPSTGMELSFYKTVIPDNYQFPHQKFDLLLPSFTLNVTDDQILVLYNFAFHFPKPVLKSQETSRDGGPEVMPIKLMLSEVQLDPDITTLRAIRKSVLRRHVVARKSLDVIEEGKPSTGLEPIKSPADLGQEPHFTSDDSDSEDEGWRSIQVVQSVEDYLTDKVKVKMLLRVQVGEMVLQLSVHNGSDTNSRDITEYLMFRLDRIVSDMATLYYVSDTSAPKSCGMALHASIGTVRLVDKLHTGSSGAYLELLKTESDKELISLSYRQINPDCPVFGTDFHYTENEAVFIFNNMTLRLDQTGVCFLKKRMEQIQERIQNEEKKREQLLLPRPPPAPLRRLESRDASSRASRRLSNLTRRISSLVDEVDAKLADAKKNLIKLHVSSQVGKVGVHLCNLEKSVAEVQMIGLDTQIAFRKAKTSVRCRLKDVVVQDMCPDTMYPNVVIMEEQDKPFFYIRVEQFKHDQKQKIFIPKTGSDVTQDYNIKLQIGDMQVAYVNRFLWDVTKFFEPMKSPEIVDAANATMETMTKQMTEIQPSAVRVGLSIDMKIPTILIPKNSKSPDFFLFRFDCLQIRNSFKRESLQEGNAQDWNVMTAKIKSMHISRGKIMDERIVIQHNVIEPVDFQASVSLALKPVKSKVMYDVAGDLYLIKANLFQSDIKLLRDVLNLNLTEGAPKSTKDELTPEVIPAESEASMDDSSAPGDTEAIPDNTYNAVVTLQGLVMHLYEEKEDSGVIKKIAQSRVEIGKLVGRVNTKSEGDVKMDVNLSLQTLSVEDVRPTSKIVNKRIIYCTRETINKDELLPLISVIYKEKRNENKEADIRMEKITVNIHVTYLVDLYNFIMQSLGQDTTPRSAPLDSVSTVGEEYQIDSPPPEATSGVLTLYGTIKQPEFVLFGNPEEEDSRVLVFEADMEFDMKSDETDQKFSTKVKEMKMYCSTFLSMATNRQWVIQPCTVDFSRTFANNHTHYDVILPKLDIYISPQVLKLIFDVSKMYTDTGNKDKEAEKTEEKEQEQDLWTVKKTSSDKWLSRIDDSGQTENPLLPKHAPQETLSVMIEKINTYFRIKNLDHHVDLLCIFCSLDSEVNDWSKKLHMKADIQLKASYFNEKLSVWEPLVEPVCDKDGMYRPWSAIIKIVKGRSYPMAFNHVHEGVNMEEWLREDVNQLLHKRKLHSGSSESETDDSTDMTVIRPKFPNRSSRLASEKSHESLSHQASIQGESDSEPDGLIQSITNKLGGIFSDDDSSEDADISDIDENDDLFDPALDKPVFLTPKGPIQVSPDGRLLSCFPCPCPASHQQDLDEVDNLIPPDPKEIVEEMGENDDENVPESYYLIVASQDKLLLNVTPQAMSVLTDINKAMTEPAALEMNTVNLPAFQLVNKLGVKATMTLHPEIKIHKENIEECQVLKDGVDKQEAPVTSCENHNTSAEIGDSETDGLIANTLGTAGHVMVSSGAWVFDNDEDYLSGQNLSINRFRLQVEGFNLSSTVLHSRACRQLMPLHPNKHSIKYWYVLDIDVWHGRKMISLLSPLQIKNGLTVSIEVFCRTKNLKQYLTVEDDAEEFTKIVTIATDELYSIPLFVAYNCDLYFRPAESSYKRTEKVIWWKDLLLTKDRSQMFTCASTESNESFNFKVSCLDGMKLTPPQNVIQGVPYYVLDVKPPVTIHNYIPYDIQFALEGTGSFTGLRQGDFSPLYTVNIQQTYKLHIQMQDYQGCDWTGVFDITENLEEFKAVTMAAYDVGCEENVNKHLTLTIHATQKLSIDLYVYSPYWLVNKTDLLVQVKGSKSDAVFDCQPNASSPVLFRFKKNRPKKGKIKVFNSRWSQSFSLDTVGNSGVVICHDKERKNKYRLMLQFQWSYLKLTRIVTITPFFLVVNKSSRSLRYMEENETADLWQDLNQGECLPYWPATTSDTMFVKYSDSNIASEPFPINIVHNTVLRMENGTALCVEVCGGIETSRTIAFTDYDSGDAPVRIENLCDDIFIVIRQKDQHQMTVLSRNQSILYTWDNPKGPRNLLWNVYGGKKSQESEVEITRDSFYPKRVKFVQASGLYKSTDVTDGKQDSSPEDDTDVAEGDGDDSVDGFNLSPKLKTKVYKMTIYWVSFLDGQQRVVIFTRDSHVAEAARMMYEGENVTWFNLLSLDGISLSVINEMYEEVALVSLTSLPANWEIWVKNKWKMLEDVTLVTWLEDKWSNGIDHSSLDNRIEVDFKKMAMTKPYKGDLRRVSYPGLFFQHRISKHQTFVHAKVYKIQIDNQLYDAYYQTVLSCIPTPMYIVKKQGPKPCLELGMIRRVVPENNVDTFRQFQVIIQELRLSVDWGFIESIQDTFADLLPTEETESNRLNSDITIANRSLQEVAEVMVEKRPDKIFFEMFKISPVKVHVSFSLRGTPHLTREIQPSTASDIKEFLRNSVGATFTEVKDIELKLGYFERRGVFLSSQQIQTQCLAHYRQQLMMQIYVVIFGLDVLGNPYGLIKDITEGLGDLFYEPILDTIQGEDEFSSNMLRGFQSAMGHIVGGTANSIARITGTLGNTLAYISFDQDFQKKRRLRQQQQPTGLPHSLAIAGKGFLSGVRYGLTGIVLDPIHGATEEGVEGFFKGIGKGLLGLITQPLGGVLDMVSLAFDGVRRSAEMEGVAIRMRLPRYINPYKGLEAFSWYKSHGNFIMRQLKNGHYIASDIFIDFCPLQLEDNADLLFITNRKILYVTKNRFQSGYDVSWEVEIQRIMGIPDLIDNKIIINLRDDKGSLFSGNSVEITSPEKDVLVWIQRKLESVIRRHE